MIKMLRRTSFRSAGVTIPFLSFYAPRQSQPIIPEPGNSATTDASGDSSTLHVPETELDNRAYKAYTNYVNHSAARLIASL